MRRIETRDPEVLAYRGGGGGGIIAGLLLLFFGIALAAVSVSEGTGSLIPAIIMGVLGIFILLHRTGLEIDERTGTWRKWWGLGGPLRRSEGPLTDFERVRIARETRQTKHQRYTVYPVSLEGAGKRFRFVVPRSYEYARREGEEAARRLKVPLVDASSGAEVVRDPEHLDESLRDRVRRGAESIDLPEPPPTLVSRYEVDGKTLRFEIPRPGFSSRILPMLLPLVAFELIVLIAFVLPFAGRGGLGEGRGVAGSIAMIAAIFLASLVPLIVLFAIVGRRRKAVALEASPDLLRIVRGPAGREDIVELAAARIEEIEIRDVAPADRGVAGFVDGGAPIVVRADTETASFGGHLPTPEKRWIVQVLKQVLTA
jgi:hypothetical protein